MRYRLRTLLIVLAILPPLGAWAWHYAPMLIGNCMVLDAGAIGGGVTLLGLAAIGVWGWMRSTRLQTASPDEN